MEFNNIFLFVTLEKSYYDHVKPGSREIVFSSQKVRKTGDAHLLNDAVPTFMFVRNRSTDAFYFAGKVTAREVVFPRRAGGVPLVMKFTVDPKDHDLCFPNQVFLPAAGVEYKFKSAVFRDLKAVSALGIRRGLHEGIVPVMI